MQKDLTACNGPRQTNAAPGGGSRRRRMVRGLLALPLALALIVPSAALAAEPTTSYGTSTPAPTTTTVPTTTTPAPTTTSPSPKQETAPTKTSSTPKETTAAKETEPAKTSVEPTATTAAKAKSLPFTGFDLSWVVVGGLLLVAMGTSIMVVQRRRGAQR